MIMVDPSDPKRIFLRVQVPKNAGQEGKVPVLEIKKTQTPIFFGRANVGPSHQGFVFTYIGFAPKKIAVKSNDPVQNRLGQREDTHPEVSNTLNEIPD